MSAKYFALLTNIGAAKLANATALGSRLNITRMAVGDGGGVLPTPNPAQTKLINEKRRAALNTLSVDPKNPSQIIAEQVIPENEGGWWIREIGLFDDEGNLIAVANCPETYKPQLQEGSGRIQTVRMILIVSSTDAVTLKIDPAVVLATRGYVDEVIEAHEKSRKHPDATLNAKGFVQLSNATTSDSEVLAATPKAVKAAVTAANNAATAAANANTNANGRVPSARKVNGKTLTADIALTATDVGAYTKAETDTRVTAATTAANNAATAAANANTNANGRVPSARKVNGKALSADIALSAGDVGALSKDQHGADIPDISKFRENVGIVLQSSDTDDTTGRVLKIQSNGAGPFGLGSSGVLLGTGDIVVQLRSAKSGFYRCGQNAVRAPSNAAWNFLVQKWDDNTVNVIAFSSVPGAGLQFITIGKNSDSGWYPLWNKSNLASPMTTDTTQSVSGAKTFSTSPTMRASYAGVNFESLFTPENKVGRWVQFVNDGTDTVKYYIRAGVDNKPVTDGQRIVQIPIDKSATLATKEATLPSFLVGNTGADMRWIHIASMDFPGAAPSHVVFNMTSGDIGNPAVTYESISLSARNITANTVLTQSIVNTIINHVRHTVKSLNGSTRVGVVKRDAGLDFYIRVAPYNHGDTIQLLKSVGAATYFSQMEFINQPAGIMYADLMESIVRGGNAIVDANGYYKTPSSTEITPITANEIAGLPQLFPGAVAPTGWLKCNGQTFNKTLYPVLASRYPSGVLPDLRGEFVRGWDDGRGVDASRALLSAQGSAIQSHSHAYRDRYFAENGAGDRLKNMPYIEKMPDGYNNKLGVDGPDNDNDYFLYIDATTGATGGNETRPRNIAFNYIVRAA